MIVYDTNEAAARRNALEAIRQSFLAVNQYPHH